MSYPITFRTEHHRLVAQLGTHDVGAVFPLTKGAAWRFFLTYPGHDGKTTSIEAAKAELIAYIENWIDEAGLDAPCAVCVPHLGAVT